MTELSQDEYSPRSFIIFTVDEDDNAGCELHWGDDKKDIAVFASLLQAITTGELNESIRLLLAEKSKQEKNGKTAIKIIEKTFKNSIPDGDNEVIIDPLNVEIFT